MHTWLGRLLGAWQFGEVVERLWPFQFTNQNSFELHVFMWYTLSGRELRLKDAGADIPDCCIHEAGNLDIFYFLKCCFFSNFIQFTSKHNRYTLPLTLLMFGRWIFNELSSLTTLNVLCWSLEEYKTASCINLEKTFQVRGRAALIAATTWDANPWDTKSPSWQVCCLTASCFKSSYFADLV